MAERSSCANCGEPIVLGPWFLDGRLPNPSIWTHVGSGRTCAAKAKGWKRPDWPSAMPSIREIRPAPRGEIGVDSALLAAQAHEAALRDLYSRLRASGHAYAANSAHAAAEAVLALVEDLREAYPARAAGQAAP